jgi:hypothetical protein
MDQEQLRSGRDSRGGDKEITLEVEILDAQPHGNRSLGPFRVPRVLVAGVVVGLVND